MRPVLAAATCVLLLTGCTITRVGAEGGPPRVESSGLIEGHAAVGIREDDDFFRLKLFDGPSDGSLAEVSLWKLFRLEVGALGLAVGVGPFDLALGTLFYEPDVPEMIGQEEARKKAAEAATTSTSVDDCELCRQAREHRAE